jgi:ABC-type multidrug transport system fused ATPase/permease subunit
MQNLKTRETLTETATVMSKLGVSTDDFAKGIQNLTKAMGFNAQGAAQQLLNLEKFAEELGIAPSKMAADFAGAGGTLAKFGNQGVEAFKRLEIASKITGMEMQRILTLTEKFDTFEGAATMAGKLNAALGGNFVNAMDLMMDTDPVGRFEQIRDAILSTGMSFDDMTYFQKNMYKEMLGLQDVGELALLLSGRTDLMSQSFEQSAQSYEEAAERAKLVADFQEQLKMLFAEMIPVLTPIIDIFRTFFQTMAPFAPLIGLISRLAAVVLMLASALGMIATIFSPVGPLIAGLFGAMAIFNYLGGSIEYINNMLDKLIRGFSNFATRLFKTKNSPTIFEGVGILSDKFKDMSNNIEGTTVSIRTQTQELNRSPVPQAAEEMETIQNPSLMQRVFGSDATQSTQTVRQPISISLNGDKLKEFVIEVVGEKIKEVSVTQ